MTSEADEQRQEIAMKITIVIMGIDSCQGDMNLAGDEIASAERRIEQLDNELDKLKRDWHRTYNRTVKDAE